ncbi:hypothetical protein SERLADRAFT_477985 [Serpula lacrymans var. lacrymans S7.9]|nr:uncharacterized protein SERLADRAFT_477985 [Serpula lacrymans var. lacrymans S7.9]EGO20422.1 hypothetical protein SERLADRAFT_477985 [Serpula lacrymans var. lacrymans S7.9]
MTVDHSIQPSVGAYNAVILVCARSGQKKYVHEAFRLAKEMLDSNRDARGHCAYPPDRQTFIALLEGAKRIGDLGRTRWILAELVNGRSDPWYTGDSGRQDLIINEEIMMHIFHAYAAYKPPFKRGALRFVSERPEAAIGKGQQSQETDSHPGPSSGTPLGPGDLPIEMEASTFSHIPPQTSTEVVAEAKALFGYIKRDLLPNVPRELHPDTFDPVQKKFEGVQLTPRLLNAYLSVYYAHSGIVSSHQLFKTIFPELCVEKNAQSYVEAMERCAMSKKHERDLAFPFAEEVWREWQSTEFDGAHRQRYGARMAERAHSAKIRTLTLLGDLDRALTAVKTFVRDYPPSAVRCAAPKLSMRSTRTMLNAPRPLVRATSSVEVPDDTVPPLLTFTDLEILHHRLVAAGRQGDIAYLKYVCKAYEGALRVRRRMTMHAEPGPDS